MQDKTLFIKKLLDNFNVLLSNTTNQKAEIYQRLIENRDYTQSKIVKFRMIISIYSVFYVLAVLEHLELKSIIDFVLISEKNKFFSIENIEMLIIVVAPVFFALIYYLMVLAKFHRGLINVFINKYNSDDIISFRLMHQFSAGSIRSFLSVMEGESKKHKFNKYSELIYYLTIILSTILILIIFYFFKWNDVSGIIVVFSILMSVYILFKMSRDVSTYKKFKKEFNKKISI